MDSSQRPNNGLRPAEGPGRNNRFGKISEKSTNDFKAKGQANVRENLQQQTSPGRPSTSHTKPQQSTVVTMNGVKIAVSHPELLDSLRPLPHVSDLDHSMDEDDP